MKKINNVELAYVEHGLEIINSCDSNSAGIQFDISFLKNEDYLICFFFKLTTETKIKLAIENQSHSSPLFQTEIRQEEYYLKFKTELDNPRFALCLLLDRVGSFIIQSVKIVDDNCKIIFSQTFQQNQPKLRYQLKDFLFNNVQTNDQFYFKEIGLNYNFDATQEIDVDAELDEFDMPICKIDMRLLPVKEATNRDDTNTDTEFDGMDIIEYLDINTPPNECDSPNEYDSAERSHIKLSHPEKVEFDSEHCSESIKLYHPDQVESIQPQISLSSNFENEKTILFIVDYIFMINNLADARYKFINYLKEHNSNIITVGTGQKNFYQGMSIFTLINNLRIKPWLIIHANNFIKTRPLVSHLINYPCRKALIIEDMHKTDQISRLIRENGFHYVFYHCDCPQLDRIRLLNRQAIYFNYPHFVDTSIFYNYGQRKDYDIILYGCIERSVYPFRNRLFNLIQRSKKFRVLYIPFPGYNVPDKRSITTGAKLAKAINRCFIGISTSSREDYFLKKYLEIPAAYAMVAGNIPRRYRHILVGKMIELTPQMSDNQIIAVLQNALRDKEQLMKDIDNLHQFISENYSFENGNSVFQGLLREIDPSSN